MRMRSVASLLGRRSRSLSLGSRGRAREGAFQRFYDALENALRIREHVVVPRPQDAPSMGGEEGISPFVSARLGMLAAIDFDDQPRLDGSEVDYVGQDRMLSPEWPSLKTMRAQMCPEPLLGFGHFMMELAGTRLRAFGDPWHWSSLHEAPSPTFPRLRRERERESEGAERRVLVWLPLDADRPVSI
jgi:hypothetical protein